MKVILFSLLLAFASADVAVESSGSAAVSQNADGSIEGSSEVEIILSVTFDPTIFTQGLSLLEKAVVAKAEFDRALAQKAVDAVLNTNAAIQSGLRGALSQLASLSGAAKEQVEALISSLISTLGSAVASFEASIQAEINAILYKLNEARDKGSAAVVALGAALQNVYRRKVAAIAAIYDELQAAVAAAKAAGSQLASQLKAALISVGQKLQSSLQEAIANGKQLLLDAANQAQQVRDLIIRDLSELHAAFNQYLAAEINAISAHISADIANAASFFQGLKTKVGQLLANIQSELDVIKSASANIKGAVRERLRKDLDKIKAVLQTKIAELKTAIASASADAAQDAQALKAQLAELQALLDFVAQLSVSVSVSVEAEGSVASP